MKIQGLHHISIVSGNAQRTIDFYTGVLGLRLVKQTVNFDDPGSAHWYWGVDEGKPGTLITYFERDPAKEAAVQMRAGQTHHLAFAVADEAEQAEWRERLIAAGYRVSPIMDRVYFKSIYTTDPDGHIVELATVGPGFHFDEDVASLGTQLKLPPWLESQRELITHRLDPLTVPEWKAPQ
ncbi:MAG: VOC family protein [Chloroflexi bacterium]|nr:VOC family protein [Chloroflexota bacterium]MCC6892151.1 VOC family protein [Anaerolineae bacterium]